MTQSLTARFKTDGPNDLKPTAGSGLRVSVAAGAGFAAGARINSTSTESVTISAPSSGSRWDAVVLRIDWQKSTADLVAVQGTASAPPSTVTSGSGRTTSINRIPGTRYDALLALVRVSAGRSTVESLLDMRMWGGDGGPYRVTGNGLANAQHLDARVGTWIATDRSTETKRLDDDGTWRAIGTQANPYKTWNPVMRFHNQTRVSGTSGGDPVGLGNAPQVSGRYVVTDGWLKGMVSIRTGQGKRFGAGPLTIDLPLPCANWQSDVWNNGHIYWDRTNGGDSEADWPAQLLIKTGWTQGLIWAPRSKDDSRMGIHQSTAPGKGGASLGVPHNPNGWSDGTVYTFELSYPVDV
ncbi:hypothetical protein [Corynebacterium mastitidis]|uniref:hypothetical protein n=1 Tax=Corynebacterium mastitidis TaxID=161890 RepID=UPI002549CFCE|nr:hypothetical protein [Corynebacterium mastitidis]MDK8450998.1 hypothetical protein [Corynebacterium mastitidis]